MFQVIIVIAALAAGLSLTGFGGTFFESTKGVRGIDGPIQDTKASILDTWRNWKESAEEKTAAIKESREKSEAEAVETARINKIATEAFKPSLYNRLCKC